VRVGAARAARGGEGLGGDALAEILPPSAYDFTSPFASVIVTGMPSVGWYVVVIACPSVFSVRTG
jgi:hypothetical protein